MEIIKIAYEKMLEEIADARCYAKMAVKYKDEFPAMAKVFSSLAEEEMTHMAKLHDGAGRLIAEYKAKSGAPPAAMQAVYDYLHEQAIDKAAEVRGIQKMYGG